MTTKLIRDLIPHIAAARGQHLTVHLADQADMADLLKAKLREEADEAATAEPGQLLEELADVLEVVQALTLTAGHTLDQLHQARADKARERGGFTRGLVLQAGTRRRT